MRVERRGRQPVRPIRGTALLPALDEDPTSEGSRAELDGPFEAGRAIPVSYMSSSNPTPKVRKFITHRSLLIAEESPVSHPPSYCGSNSASYPEGNSRDCSAGNPVRNPESYLVCYSVSNRASYLERNSASCSESCLGRNPAESSSGYPENRRASNPQSNLPSNGADNPPDSSEDYPENSLPGHLPRNLANLTHWLLGRPAAI